MKKNDLQIMLKKMKDVYRKLQYFMKSNISSKMNYEEAIVKIESERNKDCPKFTQKNEIKVKYDLEIIIPVYNTEQYLEECIESVLTQATRYSFGITIVNDGSTDNSSKILQTYSDRENIKIIHQQNSGLSSARNSALKEINGRYIMFLDSDDKLLPDAIESLMNVAKNKNADMVAGGYEEFSEKQVLNKISMSDCVLKKEPFEIPGFACMKIFRAELVDEFCFPENFLYEDTVISKLLYYNCKNVYVVPEIIYGYRIRSGSISSTHDVKCIDTFWITKYCLEESVKRGYSLDKYTYKEYLKQCYINYLRTRYLSEELQESLFILTADMLNGHWKDTYIKGSNKFKMLDQALKRKSFKAYRYILERWELF